MVWFLLKHNAYTDNNDNEVKQTPLFIATNQGRVDIIELLVVEVEGEADKVDVLKKSLERIVN